MDTQITRFTHYKLFFSLFFFFILSTLLPATSYAMTPDGETPAVERVCSKLPQLSSVLFGMCNAYCEALDCDENPEANEKSCNSILTNFTKRVKHERMKDADFPSLSMPCLQGPALTIVKKINDSLCDASDNCEFVEGNTLLTLKFVVTNVGDVGLETIVVKDNGSVVCTIENLAQGDNDTCPLEPFLAEAGFQEDTATVTAFNAEFGPDPESATDSAQYTGVEPQPLVSLDKKITVGDMTDDCTNSDSCQFDFGTLLTFTVKITNEGNVTLTDIDLTDTDTTPEEPVETNICENEIPDLAPGETFTCTFTSNAEIGVHSDTAKVTAVNDEFGPDPQPAEDSAQYKGVHPAVALTKTITNCSHDPFCFFDVEDTINFQITVTNTGNVDLTEITLTDNGSPITCATGGIVTPLNPDAFFECTYSSTADAGEHTNTATVTTAEGPTASDTATYTERKFVFVTSNTFQGDLKSVLIDPTPDDPLDPACDSYTEAHTRADCICEAVADEGLDILDGKEWLAWISTTGATGVSAEVHFDTEDADGPWFNLMKDSSGDLDPQLVAIDLDDLTTANTPTPRPDYIRAPIRYEENGTLVTGLVWTGTPLGLILDDANCDNWTATSETIEGVAGDKQFTDHAWSALLPYPCSSPESLYCFQK